MIRQFDPLTNEPVYGRNDFVSGKLAVYFKVIYRLRSWQGEWFLDEDLGLPLLQKILVKPAREAVTVSEIKRVILATDGVDSIVSFNHQFDRTTRKFTYSFILKTDFDDDDNASVNDDLENYPITYYIDENQEWWQLGVSKLGVNTKLFKD